MLIDVELFFVLVVVVSSNGDGGAEDSEAEAKEIGSCGDEMGNNGLDLGVGEEALTSPTSYCTVLLIVRSE